MSEKQTANPKIYQAVCDIMAEINPIAKKHKNPQQGYMFRGIGDVMTALHPLLTKHRVFTIPHILDINREERATKSGGILNYTILTVELKLTADDGSYIDAVVIGEGMDSSDKSVNKAMSAAFKNFYLHTFCIPTEEVKDSEADSPEPSPRTRQESKEASKEDDAGYWRRQAMALGKNAPNHPKSPGLEYTDKEIQDICKEHFTVKKDDKVVPITSRSQMTALQWQKLAEEFQHRIGEQKKGNSTPPEPKKPLPDSIEGLINHLSETLAAPLTIRAYLETVYLCDLSMVISGLTPADTEKARKIIDFLQRVATDNALRKQIQADIAGTLKWMEGIEKIEPNGVANLVVALSDESTEVVQQFYKHMGDVVADKKRIRAIDTMKWTSWPAVLKLAKTEIENPKDDVPFVSKGADDG